MTAQKKNIILLTSAAIFLAAVYLILVFLFPRLPIWSVRTYDKDETPKEEVTVTGGQVITREFDMPYDYLSDVEIIWSSYDTVTGIDGTLEVTDSNGNIIAGKNITSNFDSNISRNCIHVSKGEKCRLTVTINDVKGPDTGLVVKSADMTPCMVIKGHNEGARMKSFFGLIYLFSSMAFLLLLYSCITNDGRKSLYEKIALGCIIIVSTLCFSQWFDLLMIMKGALMIDSSIKHGQFFSYYDYSYMNALADNSSLEGFGFNYDFFLMAPVALLLLPCSFFIDFNNIGNSGWFIMLVLMSVALFLLILLSARYIVKIGKVCGMSDKQSEAAKKMFMFSPLLIYITFFYGQIDILYIAVFLIALYFYFKGQMKVFTLLMSVSIAMKMLPLLAFIPLILLVRKDIRYIINHFILVMVCPLISLLFFKHGYGYDSIMSIMDARYSFTDKLFETKIGAHISVFILLYVLICIYAYLKKGAEFSSLSLLKGAMTLVFLVFADLTLFTAFHTQWLIPLVVSISFLVALDIKDRGPVILGFLTEVFVILLSLTFVGTTYMVNYGVLPFVTWHQFGGVTVERVFENISPLLTDGIHTIMAAVIIALSFILLRDKKTKENQLPEKVADGAVTMRVFFMYGIVVFFLWCYWYIG